MTGKRPSVLRRFRRGRFCESVLERSYTMARKRAAVHFLLTYLCVLLPVLIVSFVLAQNMTGRLKKQEERSVEKQLSLICNELDRIQISYHEKSQRLAFMPEFAYHKMADNPAAAYDGLNLLSDMTYFDSDVSDIFLYYDTGKIYSSRRVSDSRIHFSQVLSCTEESTRIGLEKLESPEFSVCNLQRTDTGGSVLLHYPVRQSSGIRGASSVNFTIPYSVFCELFRPFQYMDTGFIRMALPTGQKLCFSISQEVGIWVIAERDYPGEAGSYMVTTNNSELLNIQIELLYQPDQFYSGIRRWQYMNYLIIIAAMMISALIAWRFSDWRLCQLQALEREIREDFVGKSRYKGFEFTFFDETLKRALSDKTLLINQRNEVIKQQAAQMLFNGLIQERDVINRILEPCGIELFEDYYFVGSVVTENEDRFCQQLRHVLRNDLYCECAIGGMKVFCFLAETAAPDLEEHQRMMFAHHLRHVLVDMGNVGVRIGISRVYDTLSLACFAYQEACSAADHLISGVLTDVCAVWESIEHDSCGPLQLDGENMDMFSQALKELRPADALKILHKMCRDIRVSQGTDANKSYLRYRILQTLISGRESNERLAVDAVQISPNDQESFEKSMERVIRQYFSDITPDQKYEKVTRYIHEHYSDSSLSAESVAAATGLDKTHLSRLFRSRDNTTYIEYLTRIRMGKARDLLLNTDIPVKEICIRVGYLDVSSFRKKFRAFYHQNISDFRDSTRSPNADHPSE